MFKLSAVALLVAGLVASSAGSGYHTYPPATTTKAPTTTTTSTSSQATLAASCGQQCGSYRKCASGYECVKGKCIKYVSYAGGKCDDKCHFCKEGMDCVSGTRGKTCVLKMASPEPSPKASPKPSPKASPKASPKPSPKASPKASPSSSPKPSPSPAPAKCGESCAHRPCDNQLRCDEKTKMCLSFLFSYGKPCNKPCKICQGELKCMSSSEGGKTCQFPPRNCGQTCDKEKKCADGLRCNKKGICMRVRKNVGDICTKKCQICQGELKCTKDAEKKGVRTCQYPPRNCGQTCDKEKKCADGLRCNKKGICMRVRKNVGDICTKKCQVCAGELRCTSSGKKGVRTCQLPKPEVTPEPTPVVTPETTPEATDSPASPGKCGDTCGPTKKCAYGYTCSKDHKCERIVGKIGDSCEKDCEVCKEGLTCHESSKGKYCQRFY